MLSCMHSIGHRSPLESLAKESKSVPHFRCYASPPRTEISARKRLKGPYEEAPKDQQAPNDVQPAPPGRTKNERHHIVEPALQACDVVFDRIAHQAHQRIEDKQPWHPLLLCMPGAPGY